jgi:hypothetical protein
MPEVDIAFHPSHHHPLDPFADGRLVTRREGDVVEVVAADQHILLSCDFLWDVVADAEVFKPWCQLSPPVRKLDMDANFRLAPGVSLLPIMALHDIPTNRPTAFNSYPMCQHWLMRLSVGSRIVAYRIGSYRPSLNVMEASWAD